MDTEEGITLDSCVGKVKNKDRISDWAIKELSDKVMNLRVKIKELQDENDILMQEYVETKKLINN